MFCQILGSLNFLDYPQEFGDNKTHMSFFCLLYCRWNLAWSMDGTLFSGLQYSTHWKVWLWLAWLVLNSLLEYFWPLTFAVLSFSADPAWIVLFGLGRKKSLKRPLPNTCPIHLDKSKASFYQKRSWWKPSLWDLKPLDDQLSLFQLQIIALILERPLQATIAAPTLRAAAVCEPTLLFVTENSFWAFDFGFGFPCLAKECFCCIR